MNPRRDDPSLAGAALAAALEGALAAAIAADGLGTDRFARLYGKRLRFACETPPFDHTWIVAPDGIMIASGDDGPADLSVRGPLTELFALLADPREPPGEALEVCGDDALLEDFRAALSGLRPDLALLLEPLVGARAAAGVDAVAEASSRAVRELAGYAAEHLRALDQPEGRRELAERVSAGLARLLDRLREPPNRS